MEEQIDIKGEMIGLQAQLQQVKQRISELQDLCTHQDFDIAFQTDEHGKSIGVRVVCQECKKLIGYPTMRQLQDAGYTTNISQ